MCRPTRATNRGEQPQAIAPLTWVCGIAALAVVFLHIHDTFRNERLLFLRAFGNGGLGVDLFFVLSGFIMAPVYTRTPVRGRPGAFTLSFISAEIVVVAGPVQAQARYWRSRVGSV